MTVSARSLATWGAVALALSNLARAPAGTLGSRASAIILIDLVTLAVALFMLLGIASGRLRVRSDPVVSAVVAFLVAAGISTVLALVRYSPGIFESLGVVAYYVRWVVYFAWYAFAAWALSDAASERAWRNVERAILAFCIFGIFQSAFLPGFAQMVETSARAWDVQGRRLVSTILDPNFAGILIVIALLVRLARLAEGVRERGAVLATLATGLLLTLSRSAILAFCVGLLVLTVVRGLRLALMRVMLAGGLLLLPFITLLLNFASGFNKLQVDGSAAQRLIPWTRGVILIRDHPWFGVGFNAYTQAQQVRGWRPVGGAEGGLDGGLLFAAAMTGLVGLFFFVRILWRVIASARRVWRDATAPPEHRAHATAVAACICAVVVHSLFVNSLFLTYVMLTLWMMWGRLAHMTAARLSRLGATAALPLLLLAAGCDPCAGTAQCAAPEGQIAVTGAVVFHYSGAPVPGTTIEGRFTAADGTTAADTAVTDAEGLWEMRVTVAGEGLVQGSFTVTAPGYLPYDVPSIPVRRPATAGDAVFVGRWVQTPFVQFIADVRLRGSPLAGGVVTFERTGGVPATVERPAEIGGNGGFSLHLVGPQVGTTVGTLHFDHPVSGRSSRSGIPLTLGYEWKLAAPTASFDLSPRLAYGGATVFLGTLRPVGGVAFEFVRTGGIAIEPANFSVLSRPDGFFNFEVTPLANGAVIGDVTIRPPGGAPRVYRDVVFATFDSTDARDSGLWGYGEAWKWIVQIRHAQSDLPATYLPVAFRRTGGLTIEPEVITRTTNGDGYIWLDAVVRDTGVVVGELVVSPPGAAPSVIPGVSLRTNPDNEYHVSGPYRFPVTPP